MWDSGIPMLNASAVRTVVIDKPCPSSSAPFFCEDAAAGRSFCSGEAEQENNTHKVLVKKL